MYSVSRHLSFQQYLLLEQVETPGSNRAVNVVSS